MRVNASILIQRPIGAVFAYVGTPDYLPSWVAGVVTSDGPSSERQEVGATLVVQRAADPGRAHSTWEVIAYEPPRTLALRGLDDGAGVEVRWTLEGVASGATRVRVAADFATLSFFPPTPAHLHEIGARQVQDDLEALRCRLEAEPRGGMR